MKKAVTGGILVSLSILLFFSGCSSGAPDLASVKDEFVALIEASAEINDIFFGQGLPVYDRETSSGDNNAKYDEETGVYYWTIPDETYTEVVKFYDKEGKKNRYAVEKENYGKAGDKAGGASEYTLRLEGKDISCMLLEDYTEPEREFVYDESSPENFDVVRVDCPYQTVAEIKEKASSVYSSSYLAAIYRTVFEGYKTEDRIVFARYMEDESGNGGYLLKSNQFEPFFDKQTEYRFDTMKIVEPSRSDSVNVEITAHGTYIDFDSAEKKTGEFQRVIKFVLEDGKWRLDTPTY